MLENVPTAQLTPNGQPPAGYLDDDTPVYD